MARDQAVPERRVDLTLEAAFPNVAMATRAVAGVCALTDMKPEHIDEVELGLAEAINNVVEHAYDGRADGAVRVSVQLFPQVLRIDIEDEGRAMDPRLLVDPQLCFDCGDPGSLPEGGMGLALIRQLFDAIAYESHDGRNRMTLTRWLVVI